MTKEQIIAAMKECATTLGYAPSVRELEKATRVKLFHVRKTFGTYALALEASGLERHGSGYALNDRTLFLRWAGVARKLGRIPTVFEFRLHSKYNERPLTLRYGAWQNVPRCFMEYIRREGLEGEWKDVLEVVLKYLESLDRHGRRGTISPFPQLQPRINFDQPMYGAPMVSSPMCLAPINESGVMLMFGALARQMGFVVTRVQAEFPDCEALRHVAGDRWQRVLIEFEYESRNFVMHEHSVEGCDLIVCWRHNWPECPLEVLELSKVVWKENLDSQV